MRKQERYIGFLLLCIGVLQAACGEKVEKKPAEVAVEKKPSPSIFVAAPVHNFGKLPLGARVSHVFKIKNTGNANLVIDRTEGS